MAETSENTNNKVEQCELLKDDLVIGIKKELDILVKPEPLECIVCIARSFDTYDIYCTTTSGSGFTIHCFLNKYTSSGLGDGQMCPKYVCKNCLELINVFEQTEIEYIKLKETFESIISKNPLFELQSNSNLQPIRLDSVKNEMVHISNNSLGILEDLAGDSEDEPLAVTKKKRRRKPEKRKKKTITTIKRKTKSKIEFEDSWVCNMCGMQGESGGTAAETAHKMAVHGLVQEDTDNSLTDVKKEEISDGSQTFNNGFDSSPKFELEDFDDDDDNSSNYIPEEEIVKPKRKVGRPPKSKNSVIQKTRSKKEKVLHKCDQCEATYSSLIRLEQHKLKHECSKPPYICEVCGAHYKHKRACDIHIALHKGISDWKCEECNKLFPSKGALARHNNIHTGKLNYQCDLCGKSFIHTSSFKMHKLSHSGVKPHACDVCGLALMTRSHLKRHKRVHSGEKRHECPVCGKRFSERYNLAAHAKAHEAGAAAAAVPAPRRHLFRCAFCPDRFERRYMLERHMSAEHGRALERPPPTPRNTMSKLLKAQARRHAESDTKEEVRSESRATPVATQKLIAQLSAAQGPGAASAWSSAYTEFNLRADFPH